MCHDLGIAGAVIFIVSDPFGVGVSGNDLFFSTCVVFDEEEFLCWGGNFMFDVWAGNFEAEQQCAEDTTAVVACAL